MCLGIPGQVVEVGKTITENALVDVCGVKREVNIALVCEGEPDTMIGKWVLVLSLIHISEPTRQAEISYAVFCLKKKKKKTII